MKPRNGLRNSGSICDGIQESDETPEDVRDYCFERHPGNGSVIDKREYERGSPPRMKMLSLAERTVSNRSQPSPPSPLPCLVEGDRPDGRLFSLSHP